jgi:hypothetical protein
MPKTPIFFSENDLETQKKRSKPHFFSENDLKTPKNRLKTHFSSSENVKSRSLPKELKSGSAGTVKQSRSGGVGTKKCSVQRTAMWQ